MGRGFVILDDGSSREYEFDESIPIIGKIPEYLYGIPVRCEGTREVNFKKKRNQRIDRRPVRMKMYIDKFRNK